MRGDRDIWEPLSVRAAADLFLGAPFRWWISGGHALELHARQAWRPHDDLDVGVTREQAPSAFMWLAGWDLFIASPGRMVRWDGRSLWAEHHENNVWARPTPESAWTIDLTIGSGTGDRWIYRRDPSFSLLWDEAVLRSPDGVPYLAPELQLLFKSKNPRRRDDHDAGKVIPMLDPMARSRLEDRLPAGHPWHRFLSVQR